MVARVSVFLNGQSFKRQLSVTAWGFSTGFSATGEMDAVFIADGGVSVLPLLGLQPAHLKGKKIYWTGDGDSLSTRGKVVLHRFRRALGKDFEIIHKRHQESSDLAVALDLLANKIKHRDMFIEVFGALGGRFDHALINLLELRHWLKTTTLRHPRKRFCVVCHPLLVMTNSMVSVGLKPGRTFSVVTDNPHGRVDIEGATYAGRQELVRPSSGLSNSATGNRVNFSVVSSSTKGTCENDFYFVLMGH